MGAPYLFAAGAKSGSSLHLCRGGENGLRRGNLIGAVFVLRNFFTVPIVEI